MLLTVGSIPRSTDNTPPISTNVPQASWYFERRGTLVAFRQHAALHEIGATLPTNR
jgi:hypothetical protein